MTTKQKHRVCNVIFLALFFLMLIIFNQANATIYKCTIIDPLDKYMESESNANKEKTVYSDEPCDDNAKQNIVVIQPSSIQSTPQSNSQQDLDSLVTQAVLKQDFTTAKRLATTKGHWRLIAIAEGNARVIAQLPTQQVIVNNPQAINEAQYQVIQPNNGITTSRTILWPYGYQVNNRPYRFRHGYGVFNKRGQGFGRVKRRHNDYSNRHKGLRGPRGMNKGAGSVGKPRNRTTNAKTFGVKAHAFGKK